MSLGKEPISYILKQKDTPPNEISLWFRASTEARSFHCPTCGKNQFYRQHHIIAIIEDDMSQVLMTPPLTWQCQKCGDIFHIHIF